MSRSLRRHHAARVRARRLAILAGRWNLARWPHRRQLWKDMSRLVMNEPGWWVREFVTQPARVRSRHLCRLVELGSADPDGVNWPDYRRPHVYYW